MLDFEGHSALLNAIILLACAMAIWRAGTRLSVFADEIARRSGMGRAFAGLLLLSTVTSLPEVATTITGASLGNPALVTGNLFGGVAFQTLVLAIVDFFVGKGPLTYFSPKAVVILQGICLILILSTNLAMMAVREPFSFGHVGFGSILVFSVYVFCLYASHKYEGSEAWKAVDRREIQQDPRDEEGNWMRDWSHARLYGRFAALGAIVLVAGFLVAKSADALAVQTGLGSGLVVRPWSPPPRRSRSSAPRFPPCGSARPAWRSRTSSAEMRSTPRSSFRLTSFTERAPSFRAWMNQAVISPFWASF